MAHLNGNHSDDTHVYEKLGRRIDRHQIRTPWNEAFHNILRELYTTEEADLVVKMPYRMSDLKRISEVSGMDEARLRRLLDSLCSKGLVLDMHIKGDFYYTVSPLVVGIFEVTMMRTTGELNYKAWAGLFAQYMDQSFFDANFGQGETTTIMRALPHEEAIRDSDHMKVLDYESAIAMTEGFDKFSIGVCSCRHKSLHTGHKECNIPLEKCSSFGPAADYMIRHGLAREVSKSEMLDNIAHSKENALVLNADSVKNRITYICHCCKDCCMALRGISEFGYPNTILTSSYIAEIDDDACNGCGKCARTCGINAIEMVPVYNSQAGKIKKKKRPMLNVPICLGCGACALKCPSGAMGLVKRAKRVILPEDTFERVILMHLDRGTLEHQLLDNPRSLSQKFLRGLVGGFLRLPPVKKALMSDALCSRFLGIMRAGVQRQGKGHLAEI